MAQPEATYIHFWERLVIAIMLTVLIICYESSWFNTVVFTSPNIQLEETGSKI